jgi:hypothetical protein
VSAEATGLVWKHSPYQGAQLLVHLAIADVVNDAHGDELWMSVPNLARKARVGRSTAFDALAHMVEHGYLAKLESGQSDGKPSRYRFLVDKFPGGVQRLDGGVQIDHGNPSRSRTQNSITNSNERAEFSTSEKRPAYGGRFRGELRVLGRCTECGALDFDCICPR